jgi:hypothetical protein
MQFYYAQYSVKDAIAQKVKLLLFWVVTPCGLISRLTFGETYCTSPEDEDSRFLQNVGIHLGIHTPWQNQNNIFTAVITSNLTQKVL